MSTAAAPPGVERYPDGSLVLIPSGFQCPHAGSNCRRLASSVRLCDYGWDSSGPLPFSGRELADPVDTLGECSGNHQDERYEQRLDGPVEPDELVPRPCGLAMYCPEQVLLDFPSCGLYRALNI